MSRLPRRLGKTGALVNQSAATENPRRFVLRREAQRHAALALPTARIPHVVCINMLPILVTNRDLHRATLALLTPFKEYFQKSDFGTKNPPSNRIFASPYHWRRNRLTLFRGYEAINAFQSRGIRFYAENVPINFS